MESVQFKKRKYFSKAQKLKILSELDSGFINCSELARKYDIHPVTIYSWKRGLRDMTKDKKSIDVEELLAENQRLKQQVDALKSTVSDLAVDKRILEISKEILLKEKRKKKFPIPEKLSNKRRKKK